MTDPQALAQAALAPETFNFAEAVRDRAYPELDVPFYLDEKTALRYLQTNDERNQVVIDIAARNSTDIPVDKAEILANLDALHEQLAEKLKGQTYVAQIKGISPEESLKIEAKAQESFPLEYIEATSPITGAKTKTLIENEDRDELHAMLIRQAHLVQVTAPNGAIDSDFSDLDKIVSTFNSLPLLARMKIDQGIGATTIAVDFYRELADEVF